MGSYIMDYKLLREKRKTRKMRQQDVALLLGISQPYYSQIEKGRRNPPVILVEDICDILGLELRILIKQ